MSDRPHVTVYNEISLDGKISGFDMMPGRYYERGFRWPSDAILMGGVTAEAFGPMESIEERRQRLPVPETVDLPPGFETLVSDPRPMLVVPDSRGRLHNWLHARRQPWYGRIVALVCADTPTDYLKHLDRRGIEHLRAGQHRVDLAVALDVLYASYGIQSIRTDSGGALNGALLAAGLVDRIAVILAPRVGSDPEAAGLIRLPQRAESAATLSLVECELLDDGAVWLVYDVVRPALPGVP